jgi:hypothetical protein
MGIAGIAGTVGIVVHGETIPAISAVPTIP